MAPGTPTQDLASAYPLSNDQIEQYRRQGWICLREVCSPEEIARYRATIVEATMRHNRETRPIEERDTYGRAFLQVTNLWVHDETVKKFVLAPRFAAIASQLMLVDRVRLYHDQALFKEPGGGHTPWHQDQFYWPLDTPTTITMWMPLVDIDPVMGSMTFASGSHQEGFVPLQTQISDASEQYFEDFVRDKGYPCETAGAMTAGDATFHSGFTLHRAPGNPTDRVREVMTIIYYPDGTKVHAPLNDFQELDRQVWLDSISPGEPAAGPLNPVLEPI